MTIKTVVITGAASGIGRHWANALLNKSDEYRLVLADINEEGLRAAFKPSEHVRLHLLDIRSVGQWRSVIDDALQNFGRVDYLFNVAGANRPMFFRDQPIEAIDRVIDVNLKGALIGMKLVGDAMRNRGRVTSSTSRRSRDSRPRRATHSIRRRRADCGTRPSRRRSSGVNAAWR